MNKINNSTILVTGGAGFIGSYVIEDLLKHKPKKIIIIDNLMRGSLRNMENFIDNPIVEFNDGDIRDLNQTFYGAAKLWGEQILRNWHFMYELDYVALRYFNVYGPRMDTDGKYTEVMIKWLDCIKDSVNPLIYGDGLTSMDFVYVKDVAKANVNALLSDVTDEVFNVGNSVETNLIQLLESLIEVNKVDLIPEFRDSDSINPVSRRIADISKANKMIDYEPSYDLKKGLKELSDWYFKIKSLKKWYMIQ